MPGPGVICCGPREASTTSARYWAMVMSSAAAPSDRVATAIKVRLAVSTASTAASSATCSVTPDGGARAVARGGLAGLAERVGTVDGKAP